ELGEGDLGEPHHGQHDHAGDGGDAHGDPGDEGDADGQQAEHEQAVGPPGAGDGVEEGLEGSDLDRGQEALGWGATVDPGLGRWGGVVEAEGLVQERPQEHKPHRHPQDGQGLGGRGGDHGAADLGQLRMRWDGLVGSGCGLGHGRFSLWPRSPVSRSWVVALSGWLRSCADATLLTDRSSRRRRGGASWTNGWTAASPAWPSTDSAWAGSSAPRSPTWPVPWVSPRPPSTTTTDPRTRCCTAWSIPSWTLSTPASRTTPPPPPQPRHHGSCWTPT